MAALARALHLELALSQAPAGFSELTGLQAWGPVRHLARFAAPPADWLPRALALAVLLEPPLALRAFRGALAGAERVLRRTLLLQPARPTARASSSPDRARMKRIRYTAC